MEERYTCRDKSGAARIMPGHNLMDAIEALTRIEEQKFGAMVAEPSNFQQRCADYQRKRWAVR